jgi:hypothetical protein
MNRTAGQIIDGSAAAAGSAACATPAPGRVAIAAARQATVQTALSGDPFQGRFRRKDFQTNLGVFTGLIGLPTDAACFAAAQGDPSRLIFGLP